MYSTPDHLIKKFQQVANSVKKELKSKGVAIPVKKQDGSIQIENYAVAKEGNFYVIKNRIGDIIVDKINLPQTALLMANSLALGKIIDFQLHNLDRQYGYSLFEIDLLKKHAEKSFKEKNIDRANLLLIKLDIVFNKMKNTKYQIAKSFEKLRNLH